MCNVVLAVEGVQRAHKRTDDPYLIQKGYILCLQTFRLSVVCAIFKLFRNAPISIACAYKPT